MRITDAQYQMRTTYRGGLPASLVTAALWFAAAAAGTWGTRTQAVWILLVGGMFIFPLTMLALRLAGRPATTGPGNFLNPLAMQVAFTVPLSLPLVIALARHDSDWFFPAMMIVVGAHYLPFQTLYGMWTFPALGALMLAAGVVFGWSVPGGFATPAWITGALILLCGVAGWRMVVAEERRRDAPPVGTRHSA